MSTELQTASAHVGRPTQSQTDEAGSTPVQAEPTRDINAKGTREFLSLGRRNLSAEELASPTVARFLIAEIERLDGECARYSGIEHKYNEQRVEMAALQARHNNTEWLELLSTACLAVGSAGIGAAGSYLAVESLATLGWVFAIGSAILVLVGVWSRVRWFAK